MLVAPSILAADFLHLEKDVETVNRYADIFHLDIMDGSFVPNISFGIPVVEAIASAAKKPLDVHLMIVNPEKYIPKFAAIGASMISFHYEASMEKSGANLDLIHSLGLKAGIAINPDCPVESIYPFIPKLDYVLIMSVFAGFGGQSFIPESLDRIKMLRERLDSEGSNADIEVDGGIGPGNCRALKDAGATILVAGSSVFKSEDPQRTILQLQNC